MIAIRRCLALLAVAFAPIVAAPRAPAQSPPTEAEAARIGAAAYIYGYPLVTMELTRRVMTNAATPAGNHAPMGQFFHATTYPDAAFRDVTAPNADTLYSTAWLDLSRGPYVVSLPDEGGRFYLLPMLSGWTDVFAVPGKRTTGTGPQRYAITGPGWSGTLPEGVTQLKSPTAMVWILGRTYCTGSPADYEAVHALQARYTLTPLDALGGPYSPPPGRVDPAIDMKTPVRDQVHALDAAGYFRLLATLMRDNPPAEADAPIVADMAKIGLVPGRDFDASRLDPAVARALAGVPHAAQETILGHARAAGREVNGWTFSTRTGVYGIDYLQRAYVTAIGLGANRPEDAVYPTTDVDSEGRKLDGARKYRVRFAAGQAPPVDGFWSLTMYDAGYFFVANRLNRSTLSARDTLEPNADGSIDLDIQHASPGEGRVTNWLPAPEGPFRLMLRLYWPKASVLDGSWSPPRVERLD